MSIAHQLCCMPASLCVGGFRIYPSFPQLRGAQNTNHLTVEVRDSVVFCGSCRLEWPGLEISVIGFNSRNPSVSLGALGITVAC